jgi:hypothetical protein
MDQKGCVSGEKGAVLEEREGPAEEPKLKYQRLGGVVSSYMCV